jgi:predicted negative regulator of RcsB-dependent stress response
MNSEEIHSARMLEFLTWVEVNKKRLLNGAIGVLVAIVVAYLYHYFQDQRELTASSALLEVSRNINASGQGASPAASSYLAVAERFAGTQAGERAQLLGAGALFGEKKYDEARSRFETFLSRHPQSQFVAVAAFGVASAYDAVNQLDQALTAYQRVVNDYSATLEADQARLAMALIHQARNQPDQAIKIYDQLVSSKGGGPFAGEAAMRREMLVMRKSMTNALPVLAPTLTSPLSSNSLPVVIPPPKTAPNPASPAKSATTNAPSQVPASNPPAKSPAASTPPVAQPPTNKK